MLIEKKHAARLLASGAVGGYEVESTDQDGSQTSKPGISIRQATSGTTNPPASPGVEPQHQSPSSATTGCQISSETTPNCPSRVPTMVILLKSPRLLAALYGVFVNFTLLACFDAVLPLYVTETFGWGSLGGGLIFLCVALPSLGAPLVGMVSDRHGPRWISVCGFLLTTPPLVLLRLITHNSLSQIVLLCALLTLSGKSIPISQLMSNKLFLMPGHQASPSTSLCRHYLPI